MLSSLLSVSNCGASFQRDLDERTKFLYTTELPQKTLKFKLSYKAFLYHKASMDPARPKDKLDRRGVDAAYAVHFVIAILGVGLYQFLTTVGRAQGLYT